MRVPLLFILFCTLSLQAQERKSDFAILFKSGNYIPEENISSSKNLAAELSGEKAGSNYYVLLQFYSIPSEEIKEELRKDGITLGDYLPEFTFTAVIPVTYDFSRLNNGHIRAICPLQAKYKMEKIFFEESISGNAGEKDQLNLNVILFNNESAVEFKQSLRNIEAVLTGEQTEFRTYSIRIPVSNLTALSLLPFVQWIEPALPKPVEENVPGKSLHRSNVLNDGARNLTGSGVKIGEWDGGTTGPHLDFTGRLTNVESLPTSNHGTHVAGTVAGAGLIDPVARGMAPAAQIYSYDFEGSINSEMSSAVQLYNIVISQNSWGYGDDFVNCTTRDPYNSNSNQQDVLIRNNPHLMIIFSTGNSQGVCTGGWGTTTGKAAKNIIAVGNVNSSESISSSSSFGPVADGRLKPDVCAMGSSVYSSIPNNSYTTMSGTSMACPGTSGTTAQLYEYYRQLNSNANPPSSLLKSVLCNTAKDLGNPGPDYKFGYGRINGLLAAKALETTRYKIDSVSNGQLKSFNITVPAGASRLKVLLCWTDPAGAVNANPALVNDLDLRVVNPSSIVVLPWILDPVNPGNNAIRNVDRLNNIEQVTIDAPFPGTYTIEVNGFAVPTGPRQIYSVTWEIESPYIEVTYPNGGEQLAPGASEVIMWDHSGVTSNQTIQYSTNNGSSWTNISTTVASTINRHAWTVPSTFTSQARIRITSGTLTDMSDNVFRILGVPGSLAATTECSQHGGVRLTWNSVSNATHYDILKLDTVNGVWNVFVANVTGTSYIASGNTPNIRHWFTLQAKNNTNLITGRRAKAVNAVASESLAIPQPSAITGQTNVCAQTTGVSYSIPSVQNATSYSWTVPSGSVITSGQGTTSINVTFGGTSGNIIVTPSNSCQSGMARSLTVNVASVGQPGAISGDANVCASDSNQLYSIGSVTGATLYTWSAPGGAIISGQGSNSVQISFDNESGELSVTASNGTCASLPSSLPVSVKQLPSKPIISPGGLTQFCNGSSVQLNAQQSMLSCNLPDYPQCNGVEVFETIGTGSASNTTTAYPSAYGNYYEGTRQQYLIRASELSAMNLTAGSITSLSFNVTSAGTAGIHHNYTIKLLCTSQSTITTFQPGGQIVYGPVSYLPVSGMNKHVFSSPFTWDGISNIIVEICHNNNFNSSLVEYTENARVSYEITTFTSCVVRRADNVVGQCASTTVSLTSSNRPVMTFTACRQGTNSYQWSPAYGLNATTGLSVNAEPSVTTTYTLTTTNDEGCQSVSDPLQIIVNNCGVTLNLKVFIEGFYLGSGTMNACVDPVSHPLLSDTVTVSLMNAVSPFAEMFSSKGVISTTGEGSFSFSGADPAQQYYLKVRHRNSIETWSASPVLFTGGAVVYDFTNIISKAFGNNQADMLDGSYAMYSGDISDSGTGVGFQDGIIESQDYSDMENAVMIILAGYKSEDLTGDGVAESADYSLLENNLTMLIVVSRP